MSAVDETLRKVKILIYVIVAALLAGCGYKPLYGTASNGQGIASQLSSISIQETDTRVGQLIRNNLLSSMRPAGTAQQDLYSLVIKPSIAQTLLAEGNAPDIHRMRLRLSVGYSLVENSSGKEVNSGKTFSNVSYDVVEEPIADLEAETNATSKAAQEVGQDIRIRLAAFMANK